MTKCFLYVCFVCLFRFEGTLNDTSNVEIAPKEIGERDFLYMLSDELQRFLSEINSESNKSDIIAFVIFTVCKNRIFNNSCQKV